MLNLALSYLRPCEEEKLQMAETEHRNYLS